MAKLGIAISGPLQTLPDVARRCEDAGFDSIWIPETARTAPIQSAAAIAGTTRARIGTNIALAFPRSPVITAMTARDLSELSGGRFVLGLGTQVKRVNELRYATAFEHPAPKMREIIEVCRAVWAAYAGEPIDHRGRFFTVTMGPFPGAGPPPSPIPIFVAGVNDMMLGLAGELCDGFLGHPLSSPSFLGEVVMPVLDRARGAAGRAPGEVEVVQSVICSVDDDRDRARAGAKLQIAFYGTTRTYRRVLDHHGFGDLVDPLRERHAAGDLAGMIELIGDEVADTFSVSGTSDEVREGLARFDGLCDEVVINTPWAGPDLVRNAEVFDRLISTFAA